MISEWFMSIAAVVLTFLADLFPEEAVPTWFTDFTSQLNQLAGSVSGLGVWVPWVVLNLVVGACITWWGIGFAIKLARVLIGHLPWVGGNG